MAVEWIIFEIFINIVEVGIIFYLLCKKLSSKYNTSLPTLLCMAGNIIYLSIPLFISFKYYLRVEIITFIIYLLFVLLFRNGSVWKKIFWVSFAYALIATIAMLSVIMFSLLTGISAVNLMNHPSGVRLLLMITSKIFQIILFYTLSLKKDKLINTSSLIVCFIVPLISFLAIFIIFYFYYEFMNDIDYSVLDILFYIVSISYLIINIIVFILYEMINKEAVKNYILTSKQQQYEIMERHNNEIIKIYSDIREWRHDYTNHMQLIMVLLENSETKDSNIDDAVNYIKNLDEKIKSSSVTVSTGNYIVDAIISAKLALASSFDIKFTYNVSLTESLPITEADLCAMLSNILDNAIEACCKLEEGRYINFESMIIKNQIHLQISNSTNGEYRKEAGKFKTTKRGQWHGIGMKQIESIVGEYSGIYTIKAEARSFITQISIPLKKTKTAVLQ